jgi:AraC-like DNA-binding protein
VWGARGARRLRERLLEAPPPDETLRVLECALLEQVRRPMERHPAVRYAIGEFTSVPQIRTVSDITSELGFTARRFIETFSDQVGMTPKAFCRVRRFQEAVRLAAEAREIEWVRVAADCGYFDQAHFIRDFRAFSGINPSDYRGRATRNRNHVAID